MNSHLPGAGSLQQEMQPFNLQPQQERAGTLWIGVSPIIRWFHKGFVTTLTISCNPEGNELGSSVVFVCRICLTLLMRLSYTDFLSVSSPLIRSLLRSLSRLYAGKSKALVTRRLLHPLDSLYLGTSYVIACFIILTWSSLHSNRKLGECENHAQ